MLDRYNNAMKVAVVGAGISGLAAARTLKKNGVEPTLFEVGQGPGGRCATQDFAPYRFDSGATSIAPRGRTLERVMLEELPQDGLQIIEKPIWTMEFGRVTRGDAVKMAITRYVYAQGINHLPALLAEGLDVRYGIRVTALDREGEQYLVNGEAFDSVILAIPLPETAPLLESVGEAWRVGGVRYRSCLSVLLGYEVSFDAPYHALIDPEQRNPVIWVSAESLKSADRAPEGHSAFVVQMGARFSAEHFQDSDYEIAREAKIMMERLLGDKFANPSATHVRRWRNSQPEISTSFETANRNGTNLILAGDALSGPRVELAYEVGVRAAEHLLQK